MSLYQSTRFSWQGKLVLLSNEQIPPQSRREAEESRKAQGSAPPAPPVRRARAVRWPRGLRLAQHHSRCASALIFSSRPHKRSDAGLRPHNRSDAGLGTHKGSCPDLKHVTMFATLSPDLSVVRVPQHRSFATFNAGPKRSEGPLTKDRARTGHSQKIVPGLESFNHVGSIKPGPERSEGPACNHVRNVKPGT